MKLRKSEYFRLFSDSINLQPNENYDWKLICRHKREYQEFHEKKKTKKF